MQHPQASACGSCGATSGGGPKSKRSDQLLNVSVDTRKMGQETMFNPKYLILCIYVYVYDMYMLHIYIYEYIYIYVYVYMLNECMYVYIYIYYM